MSRRFDKFRLRMTVYNKHIHYNALVEFQRKGAISLTTSVTVLNKIITTNITYDVTQGFAILKCTNNTITLVMRNK